MNPSTTSLQNTLKQARHARRLSQLELSLRVGVSQRHLSFVESGRANPSRQLLMAWLQELEAPLALRNAAMLQAGYAPAFGAAPLSDPSMDAANSAIAQLLKSHDPMPAFVIDAHWNLLRLNQGGQWLAATLMPWITALPATSPLNMLDLLVHPQGFASQMLNLSEVGPVLLAHLRGEASIQPAIAARVDAFADCFAPAHRRAKPCPASAASHVSHAHLALRHRLRRADFLQHVHHLRHPARHHAGVAADRAHVCGRCGHSHSVAMRGERFAMTFGEHDTEG